MLADFIRQHDFDIIFAQEVTSTEVLNVRGYNVNLNIGASICGTAILANSTLLLTNTTTMPSGRAIAADYKGIRLINVFAPSGTARRADREQFYTTKLPYLFQDGPTDLLIGRDFNCVLHPSDTTGHFQPSRALSEMIRGLELHDAWKQNPARPTYTYYSPHGATRLDPFYITSEIQRKKWE
jgi:exonuclease III